MGEPVIVELTPDRVDACVAVVESLPEWFGYEGALETIVVEVATKDGFVALDGQEVVGFVTTVLIYDETLEVTYLAVGAAHRRRGIGRALLRAASVKAGDLGADSIVLLTLGPSSESPHYAETVAFYRSIGFWRTKELYLSAWGGAPTLVMSGPRQQIERGLSRR